MVYIGMLLFLVLIAILAFAGAKSEAKKEGGEKVIKSVYIYLVLFATLMMTIGGSVGAFMALADMIAPTPYYQTYEDFQIRDFDKKAIEEAAEKISEDEMRKRYENAEKSHRQNQTERAKNSLVKSFGWIIIPLPVFIGVQRRLKKKEE